MPQPQTCCEKCVCTKGYEWNCGCHNADCPCHTPQPQKCCEKCLGKATGLCLGIASRTPCPCHEPKPSPASTEEWEKEFDERFMSAPPFNYEKMPDRMGWYSTGLAIKSFIRSHDQQLRQRIVEIIKNKREMYEPAYEEADKAIVETLSELEAFITNLK